MPETSTETKVKVMMAAKGAIREEAKYLNC